MKYNRFKLLAFFVLCSHFALAGVNSNQAIVDSMLNAKVEEWQQHVSDSTVYLMIAEKGEKAAYLNVLFGNAFRQKGFKTFRNFTPGKSLQGTVFEISHFDVSVNYREPVEDRIWDSEETGRWIHIAIDGQMYSTKNGEVKQSLTENLEFSDTIKYETINELEKSPYRFFQGVKQDVSAMQKIFEPAFIISSAVVILYLFFTQRGS